MFKKDLKIAVVGDLMLDRFIYGSVERISPEAPVPVFKTNGKTIETLGGAGNVINNLLSMQNTPDFIGSVGDDEIGETIRFYLFSKGINKESLNTDLGPYQTSLKIRYIAGGQHVLRVDTENIAPIEYRKKIKKFYDVAIISDYAKGNITKELLTQIIPRSDFVILDPHPGNKELYKGFKIDLITPNSKEAELLTGQKLDGNLNTVIETSKKLEKYARNSIVTDGSNGMYIYENKKMIRIPAEKVEVYDVSGAGDTVVSVLALAIGSGMSVVEAAKLANKAAGIVVGKSGTATVSLEELNGEN